MGIPKALERLKSLPSKKAAFAEPMECLAVSRLPGGPQWLWEILCGGPHKISGARCYVALGTGLRLGMHVNGPERHIISSKGFAGTALARRPFSNASAE